MSRFTLSCFLLSVLFNDTTSISQTWSPKDQRNFSTLVLSSLGFNSYFLPIDLYNTEEVPKLYYHRDGSYIEKSSCINVNLLQKTQKLEAALQIVLFLSRLYDMGIHIDNPLHGICLFENPKTNKISLLKTVTSPNLTLHRFGNIHFQDNEGGNSVINYFPDIIYYLRPSLTLLSVSPLLYKNMDIGVAFSNQIPVLLPELDLEASKRLQTPSHPAYLAKALLKIGERTGWVPDKSSLSEIDYYISKDYSGVRRKTINKGITLSAKTEKGPRIKTGYSQPTAKYQSRCHQGNKMILPGASGNMMKLYSTLANARNSLKFKAAKSSYFHRFMYPLAVPEECITAPEILQNKASLKKGMSKPSKGNRENIRRKIRKLCATFTAETFFPIAEVVCKQNPKYFAEDPLLKIMRSLVFLEPYKNWFSSLLSRKREKYEYNSHTGIVLRYGVLQVFMRSFQFLHHLTTDVEVQYKQELLLGKFVALFLQYFRSQDQENYYPNNQYEAFVKLKNGAKLYWEAQESITTLSSVLHGDFKYNEKHTKNLKSHFLQRPHSYHSFIQGNKFKLFAESLLKQNPWNFFPDIHSNNQTDFFTSSSPRDEEMSDSFSIVSNENSSDFDISLILPPALQHSASENKSFRKIFAATALDESQSNMKPANNSSSTMALKVSNSSPTKMSPITNPNGVGTPKKQKMKMSMTEEKKASLSKTVLEAQRYKRFIQKMYTRLVNVQDVLRPVVEDPKYWDKHSDALTPYLEDELMFSNYQNYSLSDVVFVLFALYHYSNAGLDLSKEMHILARSLCAEYAHSDELASLFSRHLAPSVVEQRTKDCERESMHLSRWKELLTILSKKRFMTEFYYGNDVNVLHHVIIPFYKKLYMDLEKNKEHTVKRMQFSEFDIDQELNIGSSSNMMIMRNNFTDNTPPITPKKASVPKINNFEDSRWNSPFSLQKINVTPPKLTKAKHAGRGSDHKEEVDHPTISKKQSLLGMREQYSTTPTKNKYSRSNQDKKDDPFDFHDEGHIQDLSSVFWTFNNSKQFVKKSPEKVIDDKKLRSSNPLDKKEWLAKTLLRTGVVARSINTLLTLHSQLDYTINLFANYGF